MFTEPYMMAEGCDALAIITEWNEFRNLDTNRLRSVMRQPNIFDGRNIYDPDELKRAGFRYHGVGRGYNGNKSKPE